MFYPASTAEAFAMLPDFDSPGSQWCVAFAPLLEAELVYGNANADVRWGVLSVYEQWVENEYETYPRSVFDSVESVLKSLADMATSHAECFAQNVIDEAGTDTSTAGGEAFRRRVNDTCRVALAAGWLSGRLCYRLAD